MPSQGSPIVLSCPPSLYPVLTPLAGVWTGLINLRVLLLPLA